MPVILARLGQSARDARWILARLHVRRRQHELYFIRAAAQRDSFRFVITATREVAVVKAVHIRRNWVAVVVRKPHIHPVRQSNHDTHKTRL